MGSSPSADLFYGYDLGDMTDPETYDSLEPTWMQEDLDWQKELALKFGWVDVPFPRHSSAIDDYRISSEARKAAREELYQTPEYQAWSKSRDELHEIVAGVGVGLDTYGYAEGGETSYFVKVIASAQRVDDYGSVEIKTPLEVQPDWDVQLARFMELLELPVPRGKKPAWHLNCSYG
jgi:hypothetical protein